MRSVGYLFLPIIKYSRMAIQDIAIPVNDEPITATDATPIKRGRGRPRKLEVPVVAKKARGRPRIWFSDERPKYRPKDPEYFKKYYVNVVRPKLENSKVENGKNDNRENLADLIHELVKLSLEKLIPKP